MPSGQSTTISAGRMSLGAMMRSAGPQQQASAPTQQQPTQVHRSEAFTPADVERVWAEMKDWQGAGPVLRSVFSLPAPVPQGTSRLVLTLPSANHANVVAKELDKITDRFRQELKNDTVGIEVVVNETEIPKSLWTDDKVLEELIKENPALDTLINKYQLRRL